jgi:hypothetical protein
MKEIKFVSDAAIRAVRSGETALRKAWSLMEAASEKKRPSEVISQAAIRRMQGKQTGG